MNLWPAAPVCGAWSDPRHCANRANRRRLLHATGLVAYAILVLAAGGCGASRLKPIRNETEFQEQVLKANGPVLVDFFKGGCALCMFLDPAMDQLYEEYKDRVMFTKFELMRFWLEITCEPIRRRYRIGLYPTVVLFVNGEEKKRWVVDYNMDNYRKVLDEAAGAPTPKTTPPGDAAPPITKMTPIETGESSRKS